MSARLDKKYGCQLSGPVDFLYSRCAIYTTPLHLLSLLTKEVQLNGWQQVEHHSFLLCKHYQNIYSMLPLFLLKSVLPMSIDIGASEPFDLIKVGIFVLVL